ncbi:MAG: response regulator transcription factor [Gulosibacter sp.]|uniref:response regulator transcription factor n=1 Tax=Gulosibacter sp. TaxID=2817531 RepID=UPI003F8F2113
MTIRVLLVDDDPLTRRAIAGIFAGHEEIEIVGELENGVGIVAHVQALQPAVVLMDLGMPEVDGTAATAALQQLQSPPEVVILTTWNVDDAMLKALAAGASGFLLKTAAPEEIIRAVQAAAQGESVLSPASARQLIDSVNADSDRRERRVARRRVEKLTPRELAVAERIPTGESSAQIGATVHLSEASVKQYIANIAEKLGVQGRIQIAVLMTKAGYGPSL